MRRLAALFGMTLYGCSMPAGEDGRICTTPPALGATFSASQPKEQVAAECINRWAYRLAGSPGAAADVARAVMGGCRDPINAWATDRAVGPGESIWSEETGKVSTPEAVTHEAAFSLALFNVTQARAGHCKIP